MATEQTGPSGVPRLWLGIGLTEWSATNQALTRGSRIGTGSLADEPQHHRRTPHVDLLGGLNYQVEHHLFPSMARPYLRKIQSLVANRGFCAQGAKSEQVGPSARRVR